MNSKIGGTFNPKSYDAKGEFERKRIKRLERAEKWRTQKERRRKIYQKKITILIESLNLPIVIKQRLKYDLTYSFDFIYEAKISKGKSIDSILSALSYILLTMYIDDYDNPKNASDAQETLNILRSISSAMKILNNLPNFERICKDSEFLIKKSLDVLGIKRYYYIPSKIDPTMKKARELPPKLLNLPEKWRIETAKSYTTEIYFRGIARFNRFMNKCKLNEVKKRRKGLMCACCYIESLLKSMEYVGIPIFPPKPKRDWIKFFNISKKTFNKRMKEILKIDNTVMKKFERLTPF